MTDFSCSSQDSDSVPDGKSVSVWTADDRDDFLAVFHELALDGMPELKKRRNRILAEAEKAQRGERLVLLPDLSAMIDSLWRDIETTTEKHGVSCKDS